MNRLLVVLSTFFVFSLISCTESSTGPDPGKGEGQTTTYNVSVNVTPSGAGSVSPSADDTYDDGDVVDLQATANDGYIFSGWTGDITSTDNPHSLTVDQDYSITANFEIKSYELTVNTVNEGTVSEQVLKQQSKEYEHGKVVELTANPATGYKFVEWQGDVTGTDNPTQITIDDPKQVTAVFEKKVYALTVNTDGEGAVSEKVVQQKSTDYEYDTVVELTANPAEGWRFVEWTGANTGTDNPIQITVDNPKEVTAVFERKSFELTVNTTGEGAISKTPDQQEYSYNSTVDLEANPAESYTFVEWQGDVTGTDNPTQITIDDPKQVTAVFEKKSYTLTVNTDGEGAVSETVVQQKSTDYEYDTVVELTANPAEGWRFVEWKGASTGSDNPIQITVDNPKEVTAVFEEKSFELTVNTTGEGTITKTPDQQEYDYNSMVELAANPAEGYTFVEWQGDVTGTDNLTQITMDDPKQVTAVFEKKSYLITLNKTGQGSISKTPDQQEYEHGTNVDLTANPSSGWEFEKWEGDTTGTDNPVQITVDEAKDITAVFTEENTALFYLAENGVTIKCEDAQVGDKGIVNGIEYTKRSNDQIDTYNAETTCTSGITNMYNMFKYNSSFNGDINSWDVSNVQNMGSMFNNTDSFNGDLSSWDVSSVTNMEAMFYSADAFNNISISSWDVSNVEDMSQMFGNTLIFNQDLSSWNVSSVTDMNMMFDGAESFNGDLSGWDVSNVEDMEGMFDGAESFNQDLNSWDVSSVKNMRYMFYEAISFNQDLSNWNVSSVIDMYEMFYFATAFNGDISSWNVSNVEDMEGMFDGSESFNQNLNSWNVSSVIYMQDMFNGATSFNGDISDWNVSNVENMEGMFLDAGLFNQDISNWDVGSVSNMDYMFKLASSFNQDLTGWCVIRIDSKPYSFADESGLSTDNFPIWGSCS